MSAPPVDDRPDGRAERSARTRRAILHSAAELFAENGFEATGVDQIAAAAGVSKGTVFYGFGSKEAVFTQVLEQASLRLAERLTLARVGRSGWDALTAQVAAVLHSVDEVPAMGNLLTREVLGPGGRWQEERRAARQLLVTPLVATIAELRHGRTIVDSAAGPVEIDDDSDDVVAVAMLGALVFAALDRQVYAPGRTIEHVQTRLIAVLAGLGVPESG